MMNMVIADIAGQPVENAWQFVVGAAFNGCYHIVPVFLTAFENILILMLYVEEP